MVTAPVFEGAETATDEFQLATYPPDTPSKSKLFQINPLTFLLSSFG